MRQFLFSIVIIMALGLTACEKQGFVCDSDDYRECIIGEYEGIYKYGMTSRAEVDDTPFYDERSYNIELSYVNDENVVLKLFGDFDYLSDESTNDKHVYRRFKEETRKICENGVCYFQTVNMEHLISLYPSENRMLYEISGTDSYSVFEGYKE